MRKSRTKESCELEVPWSVLRDAGIEPGDDLKIEATRDGVLITADSLKKVHVEATNCNLDCTMCVRRGWREPLGHSSRGVAACAQLNTRAEDDRIS